MSTPVPKAKLPPPPRWGENIVTQNLTTTGKTLAVAGCIISGEKCLKNIHLKTTRSNMLGGGAALNKSSADQIKCLHFVTVKVSCAEVFNFIGWPIFDCQHLTALNLVHTMVCHIYIYIFFYPLFIFQILC